MIDEECTLWESDSVKTILEGTNTLKFSFKIPNKKLFTSVSRDDVQIQYLLVASLSFIPTLVCGIRVPVVSREGYKVKREVMVKCVSMKTMVDVEKVVVEGVLMDDFVYVGSETMEVKVLDKDMVAVQVEFCKLERFTFK